MSKTLTCRSCGAPDLHPVLSLGELPLANSLLTEESVEEAEDCYPLDLVFCDGCALLQITETVSSETLFRHYVYFSSYSDTMLLHARQCAGRLAEERKLDSNSLVVEIASNDGYLLQNFVAAGIPVLGIEPAWNIAQVAQGRGIRTIPEYFGESLAESLFAEGVRADVILANNVMAHVPDINGVVAGIKRLLKPDGVFVMETPYVKDLLDSLEFDTIYHEHLYYYSLTSLEALFQRHGLAVGDVERIALHGGSLRVTVGHEGRVVESPSVACMRRDEESWGTNRRDGYSGFAGRVESLLEELNRLVRDFKRAGLRIAAYGAGAKGSVLLNCAGIGRDDLDFVADRSPIKQGRFMPGSRLPILSPEAILDRKPDYTLLLTWNFAEEILAQLDGYRKGGGRFIIPIPRVRIV